MQFLERFWHGCGGDCHNGGCPITERMNRTDQTHVPFGSGAWLVGASFGVFIVPLLLAITGGHVVNHYAATLTKAGLPAWCWQMLGMLLGLGVGVLLARIALRLVWPFVCREEDAA